MLADSLTVIFTSDTITHKEKINLLSFGALKKKKKKKEGKWTIMASLQSSSKRQILWRKLLSHKKSILTLTW